MSDAPVAPEPSVDPPAGITVEQAFERLARKRRAFFDEVQRWQNLISAMIALGAAAWAWQYTQRQIEVTRDQLHIAQMQLAIGRSEVLSRRAADMEAIRLKVRELVGQASSEFYKVGPQGTIQQKPLDEEARAKEFEPIVAEVKQLAGRLPRTPAAIAVDGLVAAYTVVGSLSPAQLRELGEAYRKSPQAAKTYTDAEKRRRREIAEAKLEDVVKLLDSEIEGLQRRVVELEALIR